MKKSIFLVIGISLIVTSCSLLAYFAGNALSISSDGFVKKGKTYVDQDKTYIFGETGIYEMKRDTFNGTDWTQNSGKKGTYTVDKNNLALTIKESWSNASSAYVALADKYQEATTSLFLEHFYLAQEINISYPYGVFEKKEDDSGNTYWYAKYIKTEYTGNTDNAPVDKIIQIEFFVYITYNKDSSNTIELYQVEAEFAADGTTLTNGDKMKKLGIFTDLGGNTSLSLNMSTSFYVTWTHSKSWSDDGAGSWETEPAYSVSADKENINVFRMNDILVLSDNLLMQ